MKDLTLFFVVQLEVAAPFNAKIGVVGAELKSGALGGGNQIQFVLPVQERATYLSYVPNSGRALAK